MKTKDRIKEEIGLYKLLITIFSAIASSIIGWIFTADETSFMISIAGIFIAISLIIAVIKLYFRVTTNIEDIDYV